MIDRLRMLLDRPVRELPAGLVLLFCALVIVLGALLLSQIGEPEPSRSAPHAQDAHPDAEREQVSEQGTSGWDYGYSELPSEEGPNPARVTPADGAQVRDATRRFMPGYLAYSYGQGEASEIQAATPPLINQLAHNPPHVPDSVRRRRPRVELVHADGIGEVRAAAVATVNDGATRYAVHVRLMRDSPDTWIVTEVGPD